jgi:type IV secretion system protein VirB2
VNGQPAIDGAAAWLLGLIDGRLVTLVAIIAVAAFGFRLMRGSLAVRQGLLLIAGCFLLLGARSIGEGLIRIGSGAGTAALPADRQSAPLPPIAETKRRQTSDDPYAGASLRQ